MSKAEEYLKKSIRKCQEGDRPYNEWVSTDCAKLAVKIAREEMLNEICEWISKQEELLEDSFSDPNDFVNILKQAMKDE